MALRPYLGKNDVVTPVDSRDEKFATDKGIPGPKNYGQNYWHDKMMIHNSKGCFYEHAYAYEIKGLVGEKIWNDYFTFTIERDPRDKSLSSYYYHKYGIKVSWVRSLYNVKKMLMKTQHSTSSLSTTALNPLIAKVCNLEKWLIEDRLHAFSQNFYRYSIFDKVIVDKVFPFNKLDILQEYLSALVSAEITFPKLKSGYRKDYGLTIKEKDLLEKLLENPIFKKEIDIINSFVIP